MLVGRRPVAVLGTVLLAVAGSVAAPVLAAGSAAAAVPAAASRPGTFQSVTPKRVLDTRNDIGGHRGSAVSKENVLVPLGSGTGVPAANVSAVVVNVTVLSATASGYLAGGADRNNHTSSIQNFVGGGSGVANEVVLPVSLSSGVPSFDLYNASGGRTGLAVDVAGYFISGSASDAGSFGSLTPARVLDTRLSKPLAHNANLAVKVLGTAGVPSSDVAAVVLNVTSQPAAAAGYVSGGTSSTSHTSSILNYAAGQSIANEVVLPVNTATGTVDLYNGGSGPVGLVADVAGYYRSGTAAIAGALGVPVPGRLLDTRLSKALTGNTNLTVRATGVAGVPGHGVSAVVLNVTAQSGTAAGYLAGGISSSSHTSSILNYPRTAGVANEIVLPVSAGGTVDLFNGGTGSVEVVADVAGYYLSGTAASGIGNDISHPQCGSPLPTGQAFGLVGLNQGQPTKDYNPCFASQLSWAQGSIGGTPQPKAAIYVNTANPGPGHSYWPTSNQYPAGTAVSNPYGTCAGADTVACAYMYGYAKAYDDVHADIAPSPSEVSHWWLDVETENSWETNLKANVADLEAMTTYLKSAGYTVGIYSTNYQWGVIAGTVASSSVLSTLPNWLAGASTLAQAQALCSKPLMRGTVSITQYLPAPRTLDYDNSCS